jgi:hypothetical protein
MINPTTPQPVQEPAGAVEARKIAEQVKNAARDHAGAVFADSGVDRCCETWDAVIAAIDRLATLASLPPVTQAKSEAVADTYERYSAIREGHCNGVIDEYFQAREGWTLMPQGIFKDAFYRGFDARDSLSPESALYAAPQEAVERQPLTDTEIADCATDLEPYPMELVCVPAEQLIAFVRNIEAAHGIGPATQEKA